MKNINFIPDNNKQRITITIETILKIKYFWTDEILKYNPKLLIIKVCNIKEIVTFLKFIINITNYK